MGIFLNPKSKNLALWSSPKISSRTFNMSSDVGELEYVYHK